MLKVKGKCSSSPRLRTPVAAKAKFILSESLSLHFPDLQEPMHLRCAAGNTPKTRAIARFSHQNNIYA